MARWDVAATWRANFERWEQLDAISLEARSEAESRAWFALGRWLEEHRADD